MTHKCSDARIVVGLLVAALLAWLPLSVQAESTPIKERLARVFQDNMVLQREKPVPIWGWAKPGTAVEVCFWGQKKPATADEHGYWKAILDPMKANREPQVLTAQIGSITASCKNVLVGEVWLSAGHSGTGCGGPNVDTGVYPKYDSPGTKGGKPEIRLFTLYTGDAVEPWDDLDPVTQGGAHWVTMWEVPEPEELNQVEYFARVVRDKLDVPVGILFAIRVSYLQEQWMSRETLESLPCDSGSGNCFEVRKSSVLAGFNKSEAQWKLNPKGPEPQLATFDYPGAAYNSKIHPLAPYALRGVQFFGSSNKNTGGAPGIVAMVKQWRKLFGQDFYFVNCTSADRSRSTEPPPLAPMMVINTFEADMNNSLKLFGGDKLEANVNTKDLGSWLSHNLERAEAGRRLALATLALAYGQKLPDEAACPRLAEAKIEGGKATVRFDEVGAGLVYQPSIDGISGVYLRGQTGSGRWAVVKVISKDTLEFSHPDITDLETIAYGECLDPHETLFGSGGMPTCPFVVNPPPKGDKRWDAQPPYRMLSMPGEDRLHMLSNEAIKGARICLAHVRRRGYVFQIVGEESIDLNMQVKKGKDTNELLEKSGATVPVTAYVPKEWPGVEVMIGDTYYIRYVSGMPKSKGLIRTGGQLVKTTETTKDGARFVTFDAPVDRTWVIVAEKGHAAEFQKINRY